MGFVLLYAGKAFHEGWFCCPIGIPPPGIGCWNWFWWEDMLLDEKPRFPTKFDKFVSTSLLPNELFNHGFG